MPNPSVFTDIQIVTFQANCPYCGGMLVSEATGSANIDLEDLYHALNHENGCLLCYGCANDSFRVAVKYVFPSRFYVGLVWNKS